MVVQVIGKLEFEPENYTKKHEKQASWKRVALIRTDCDIYAYYAWFIKKRFNLVLNKPLRQTHVTFINDKFEDRSVFDKIASILNGKNITFYHELEPRSNGNHWWLRVHCPEAENIRELMGISKIPYFGLHLTIGYANDKNIDHSYYILEQCKRFELISNETRKDLQFHEIVNFEN